MKKIICLELLAFFREKFQDKLLLKIIALVSVAYFLLGYAMSILFKTWISNNLVSIYNFILVIGIFSGLTLTNKELRYFFQNIPKNYKIFPIPFLKLIFLKTIKYEVFNLIVYILMINIIAFPIILNTLNLKIFLVIFESIFLFATINKIKEAISVLFYRYKIKGLLTIFIEFITTLYLFKFLNNNISIPLINNVNFNQFKITPTIQALTVLLSIMLYLITYYFSLKYAINNDYHKNKITPKNNFQIKIKSSIIYTKIIRGILANNENNILSALISFPITLIIINILNTTKIISIGKISFSTILAISLMAQTTLIANFIFTNLLTDSRLIKTIVQSTFSLRKYLIQKMKIIFLIVLLNLFLTSISLLISGWINFNEIILLFLVLVFNAFPLILISQIFSNFTIKYLRRESFENSLSVPISLMIMFIFTMLQIMIILMTNILHLSLQTTLSILAAYIMLGIFIYSILFILMRKRYYGEFREFIK
ncbi:MAG: hypothetical protein LBC17_01040 [Lactobacillaceae bacterium]|jgi:hypothetical protein|nr:hypothetical protein [Lactobacillaceae bacterium]